MKVVKLHEEAAKVYEELYFEGEEKIIMSGFLQNELRLWWRPLPKCQSDPENGKYI